MTRVSIKVHPEDHETAKVLYGFLGALIGAFALGVSLSTIFSLSNFVLPQPDDALSQLGAVGGAAGDTQSEVVTANDDVVAPVNPISIVSISSLEPTPPVTEVTVPVVTPEGGAVAKILEDRARASAKRVALQIEMDRLTQQIERVKNNSVTLVTEFNLSCGIWDDPCALPYASQLEKYNSSYASLEKALSALSYERDLLPE